MIYRLETEEIGGTRYVVGTRFVRERGVADPTAMEVCRPPAIRGFRDAYGQLRYAAEKADDGTLAVVLREREPSAEMVAEHKAKADTAAKRAAVAAALPDILLAVAEGKDVGEETRKVLVAAAAKNREGT